MWNGQLIMVKEGQLITGRTALIKATGIPGTTIERILEMLENEHQIGQQKNNKYRLITIVNWEEYQNRTPERTTSGQQADTNKNDKKEKNKPSVANAPQVVQLSDEEKPSKLPKAKYPNAREVFSWVPEPEPSWEIDTTQLKHAELLFVRGEKKVRSALAYVKAHQDDDFFYSINTPVDLERKWIKLVNHKPV